MSQIDYQPHNFTCYTVPECSSDDDDENEENEDTLYSSRASLTSNTSTPSSIDNNNILRSQHLHHRHHHPYRNRISLPVVSLPLRELTPIVSAPGSAVAAQWGYFVPFAPNCYFSPPLQRKVLRENENDRNRRAVSYGGTTPNSVNSNNTTLPRAAPRRVSLMKDPPPPPPPKPAISQLMSQQSAPSASPIPSKYPQSDYNLIQKIDSVSMLAAPAQYQPQNFYANTPTISSSGNSNNYSSLLCHSASTNSPQPVRKRDKLLHRFSDAATLGRKLKKKKNSNRTCRSMTEAIEMLADPVIEDEFFVST